MKLLTVGVIRTPYQSLDMCPNNIQVDGPLCRIQIDEAFRQEMQGLEKVKAIMVVYWLGGTRTSPERNQIGEMRDFGSLNGGVGCFSLRTPYRPNPIGVAVLPVESLDVRKGEIQVRGLDCLDGTVLIDIKPAIYRETGGV